MSLLFAAEAEGAETHAGAGRGVEEEGRREGSSGQEEGEERIASAVHGDPTSSWRSGVRLQELEFNLLEEKLQKTLSDLEKREKQLAEAELQVRLTPNVRL